MTNLKLVPLVLLAALTPACVMDKVDNSSFIFDWEVRDVGPGGQPLFCADAGVTTVALTARNFTTNTIHTFDFPCEAFRGQTAVLPTGEYALTFQLLRADRVEVSALNLPLPGQPRLLITRRGVTDVGFITFEVQSFFLQWNITRSFAPTTTVLCAEVGATEVELVAGLPNDPTLTPFIFRFPCVDMQGLTQAVPLGSYLLSVRLLNAGGTPLSALENVPFDTPANAQAVIPPVTFTVN